MSIAWRDAMSVGDATVDADHKHLIDLINAFETAIQGDIDHKRVARVLLGLVEYTGQHFAREEELQLSIRYPYHDSHRRAHRDVLKQLSGIVSEYTVAPDGPERDAMIRTLSTFLKEWLVDHIIQSDLRMKPYVAQMQRMQQEALRKKRDAIATAERIARMEETVRRAAE